MGKNEKPRRSRLVFEMDSIPDRLTLKRFDIETTSQLFYQWAEHGLYSIYNINKNLCPFICIPQKIKDELFEDILNDISREVKNLLDIYSKTKDYQQFVIHRHQHINEASLISHNFSGFMASNRELKMLNKKYEHALKILDQENQLIDKVLNNHNYDNSKIQLTNLKKYNLKYLLDNLTDDKDKFNIKFKKLQQK